MIFQHTWEKVLSGEKTQTRRIVKGNHAGSFSDNRYWAVHNTVTSYPVWQVGNTYAVQPGRAQKAVARIRILDIRREDVRDIQMADVLAEGFQKRIEFMETWVKMHDSVRQFGQTDTLCYSYYSGRRLRWVSVTPRGIYEMLAERPANRYDAWALTFELVA